MQYFGYIAFLFIGIILGLIGGGGSILGVPVLVYVMDFRAETATMYSLFVVGLTSLIGAFSYLRKGELSAEALLRFALASMVAVFCTRKFIMPAIPEQMMLFGAYISKHTLIMIVFSVLMLGSSYSMIRKRKATNLSRLRWEEFNRSPVGLPFIILLGIAVGILTGFVGAGGGFIIVPVLMFVLQLNFKKAIGTSLCIIAINSLIGFTGNIGNQHIDWKFLIIISAISVLGILIGSLLSGKISGRKLKPAFGWFTLCVGVFVLVKELI